MIVGIGDNDLLVQSGAKSVRRIEISDLVSESSELAPDGHHVALVKVERVRIRTAEAIGASF